MTWKRVATALVLIPIVVAIVLFTNTAVVAMATSIITVLALWEYFALGDAIGHRAYRLWTIFCALLLIFSQWFPTLFIDGGVAIGIRVLNSAVHPLDLSLLSPVNPFFLFVFGLTVLTLWTRRPRVEALPAAGISSGPTGFRPGPTCASSSADGASRRPSVVRRRPRPGGPGTAIGGLGADV